MFGENYPHFHALIAARGHDIPPELRAGNILKLRTGHADVESATKLLPDVRAAHQRQLNRPDAA